MPERVVRQGILTSDSINRLSWPEECFYRRLMSVVDDYGLFDGRNSVLRASLYPLKLDHVSDSDIGKWKHACADADLVRLYSVDGREYIELLKFNQRLRGKMRWPAPAGAGPPQPAASCGEIRLSSYSHSDAIASSSSDSPASAGRPPTAGREAEKARKKQEQIAETMRRLGV